MTSHRPSPRKPHRPPAPTRASARARTLAPTRMRTLALTLALTCLHSTFFILHSPLAAAPSAAQPAAQTPGLLFHVSADKGTTADYSAAGAPEATFVTEVTTIPDGARGPALRCGDVQRLAWSAPGNIYAQRGTLSFFWRARYPVGPTEFPIFRVAHGDHSSWDMTWLRIDYNGRGFDAFVTDASLSRTRVSATLSPFPAANDWTHIAFTWDETTGVRLYINGKPAAEKNLEHPARYDQALDQFGTNSRIISPCNVQSDYNFTRGGDFDEIRIYDHALDATQITRIADPKNKKNTAGNPPVETSAGYFHKTQRQLAACQHRHGFDSPGNFPPELTAPVTTVRKVEIHDAYDQKRWWWKACDGIRETTWPGVYNRSRLPGRHDYFELPDWDCYSASGKTVTFHMPDEPWNHIEISGAAHGKMELLAMPAGLKVGYNIAAGETPPYDDTPATATPLFTRPPHAERTTHRLATPVSGPDKRIRFTNTEQEQPIGELSVYNVTPGNAGLRLGPQLTFTLPARPLGDKPDPRIAELRTHIENRNPYSRRNIVVALAPSELPKPKSRASADNSITSIGGINPTLHIIIPDTWDTRTDALDGIAIDIPSFDIPPHHKHQIIPFNIQVKDPLWPMRNMLDFSFTLRPIENKTPARTLWLDLRDRCLPPGKPIYITLDSITPLFDSNTLPQTTIRLVFKPRADALAEHTADRFTQVRDLYAHLVEESPRNPKFNIWNRFAGDLRDLLRVAPDHRLGLLYAAAIGPAALPDIARPVTELIPPLAPIPAGTPAWAARQAELLDHADRFVNWYIDHRQIADGEFGGGISDDTDLTNAWPGLALMGVAPEKIAASNRALLEASYATGLFTNGLNTIQTDELHNYEEGINALGQCLITTPSSPSLIERAMETTRGLQTVTAINAAGHRHIRSSYYGGARIATEAPWNTARAYAYLALQPAQLLADYNAHPAARAFLLELADGLLAHRRLQPDGSGAIPTAIVFDTDADTASTRPYFPWPLFWNAWQWTAGKKYLDPILDNGVLALTNINPNALDILDLRKTLAPGQFTLEGSAAALQRTAGSVRGDTHQGRGTPNTNVQRNTAFEHFRWQLTGDTSHLAGLYASQIQNCLALEYINTEGSLWIDRVGTPTTDLQRARLGGVALARNAPFHGHAVSWRFHAPARPQDLAILIPDATPDGFTIIAHNLTDRPVRATLTGGPIINPGQWEIAQTQSSTDIQPAGTTGSSGTGILPVGSGDMGFQPMTMSSEKNPKTHGQDARATQPFARDTDAELTFPPRVTTTITFRKLKAAATPVSQRPDLGIEPADITHDDAARTLTIRVHSLGSVATPATTLALIDNATDRVLAAAPVPPIPAPLDLYPKIKYITLPLPPSFPAAALSKCRIEIDPENRLEEISRKNNTANACDGVLQRGKTSGP